MVYHPAAHITQPRTFFKHRNTSSSACYNSTIIMPIYTSEERIILAIEAIRTSQKKISQRNTAKMFNIPEAILRDRIKGRPQREKTRVKDRKLDLLEEQILIRYILKQNERGFPLRLFSVEDIANLLLKSRNRDLVGKH